MRCWKWISVLHHRCALELLDSDLLGSGTFWPSFLRRVVIGAFPARSFTAAARVLAVAFDLKSI